MEDKIHPKLLSIDNYDYPLPDDRIAQFPLERRDQSKLLIYKQEQVSEDVFSNLSHHLPFDSLIIFNETRVIHARLLFHKESGSPIEIFCLEPLDPYRDHQQAFQQKEQAEWSCLVGNSKRWKGGKILLSLEKDGQAISIYAVRKMKMEGGTSQVIFNWTPAGMTFAEILELAGKIPLPPYINRKPVSQDEETYQTIYARQDGSVAAPTAGLHFSSEVLGKLKERNIEKEVVKNGSICELGGLGHRLGNSIPDRLVSLRSVRCGDYRHHCDGVDGDHHIQVDISWPFLLVRTGSKQLNTFILV